MYNKVLIFILVFVTRTFSSLQLCGKENSMDISRGTHLSNGDVYFHGIKYEKSEYYIDNQTGVEKACICSKESCIRKCCPFGLGYDFRKKVCVNTTEPFDPPVWNDYGVIRNANASKMFHFTFGKHNCSSSELRIRISQVAPHHHLKRDGNLYIELPMSIPPWTVRGPDKYCIDTFVYEDEEGNTKTQLDALVCFAEPSFDPTSYIISSTCMLISCVFILATVAVYAWLPELRNLHGRVLMAYLLSLFVGFLFLATMQILLIINNVTAECCLVLTFIIYFFLLSAFFWLNVMSFDIWWTFSGKRGLSLEKLSTRARFCAYAFYAFGVPTALTIIMAGLEFSGLPAHPLLPNIKHQGCFLFGKSKLLYFYGPIVALCVANMLFFILTALKIAQIRKQTSVLKSKESTMHDQHRNDQQRLLLYVKLFAVMGINWLLEVISALYPDADYLWRYTDAYNVLIGLITFIIFVCKRKIFRLMKKRYKQMRGEPMSRTATASSRTISSRDDIRLGSMKTNNN
ncbi:G-protein coupled receptor Mth2-like isoform X3 [Pectinophora gossypiella]|uniref:G-protein coupled receptor Mth2-like isoform X3 n=1 Tax=Pectinophora gossypiella TaxID=13191 RepID=UPI00214E98F8|nr:G-protein coupled receptor Mth2-like isoform X3 [Pectinophora gossypiella]